MFSSMYFATRYLLTSLRSQGISFPTLSTGKRGQGMVEYALILVLVAVVIIAVVSILGHQISNVFIRVECKIDPNIPITILETGQPTSCHELGLD